MAVRSEISKIVENLNDQLSKGIKDGLTEISLMSPDYDSYDGANIKKAVKLFKQAVKEKGYTCKLKEICTHEWSDGDRWYAWHIVIKTK
jgi:hypothetical protein